MQRRKRALQYDYIVMCALLYLDHVFTETLKAREEATGSKTVDAKQQKEDAIKLAELDGLHRYTVDYHMRVVDPFPEYKLAFMKETELARALFAREEAALRKRNREINKSKKTKESRRKKEEGRKKRRRTRKRKGERKTE